MKNNLKTIQPSILSFDLNKINDELQKMIKLHVKEIHYDFVSSDYAPTPTSFVDEYIEIINKHNFNINVHIMSKDVYKFIDRFLNHRISSLCFQYEVVSTQEVIDILTSIKKKNIRAGIAIRPNDINFFDLLKYCDFVLLMTVVPGKGGQKFMLESIDYIKQTYQYIKNNKLDCSIVIDGGINLDTIDNIIDYGNSFVSGTGFVKIPFEDQQKFLKKIRGEQNG